MLNKNQQFYFGISLYRHVGISVDVLCLLGQLTSRQPVVDDDSEDKVSEEALKKLGLLSNYSLNFVDLNGFNRFLAIFTIK